ncbi:DUF5134 domain-containing protein [Saccharopolyspora thermophila]|uniref:DUF5134 domain-containing protein n=1 Tax=Saccharopolyspora thermophila TaxID=89367 RepID=A0ABN1D8Z4_9PSEU
MVQDTLLRAVLTILFLGTGLVSLHRAMLLRDLPGRVSAASHVVMSAAMVAMAWPWGMVLPAAPQIAVFALSALWFLLRAANGRLCGGHPRREQAHHALMAVAMAWMVAVMPTLMTSGGPEPGHGHHALVSGTPVAAPSASGPPIAVVATTAVLGVYFVLASLPWLSAAVDLGRTAVLKQHRTAAREAACHAAMSAGMGAMLLAAL